MKKLILSLLLFFFGCMIFTASAQNIPLPEHPRPDFMRTSWLNLNGTWQFAFDSTDTGLSEQWYSSPDFNQNIRVPFPWGSNLSGIENKAHIGWYSREITIPPTFNSERTFLVIGAADWKTDVWLDGQHIGTHQGGYTPFEFELTQHVQHNKTHQLVVRVDDTPHAFKLEGKQGYGEAKGIWQTVYLEARGQTALKQVHFSPDIDKDKVTVKAVLDKPAQKKQRIAIDFPNKELSNTIYSPIIKKNDTSIEFDIAIPEPHLWTLDDPYLYDVNVKLVEDDRVLDQVVSYFGMRKISIVDLPGTDYPYVALNDKPVYLQMSLDQAYHPDGFYTYPSDEFMRDEILRSKKIGLNGNRIHIKVEIPRKLYWADKLGLLIMADVPNFWGEPTDTARQEWEYAMREMIKRDYNHPSIFSWVLFNETWGLFSGEGENRKYSPDTQEWVRSMFYESKKLDPTRLIEDNSPNNHDHVVTDLNTWHAYLPGYAWEGFLDNVVEQTYPGSGWNFIGDNKQTDVPMFNSECGNVWGYEGSTGDVDYSWDYHIMMNEFRKHPKIAGWLYTEHHDVINEWNGYYKFDRTEKVTGLSSFIPDMTLNHLHSPVYLSTGSELSKAVKPGTEVNVPLYLSIMSSNVPKDHFILDYELSGYDKTGKYQHIFLKSQKVPSSPFFNGEIDSLSIQMPETPGLYHLQLRLRDEEAFVYHLNFTSFIVEDQDNTSAMSSGFSFDPASFSDAHWSQKQWDVLDGLKVNGAGYGHFTYEIIIPESISLDDTEFVTLVFEAGAKQLFGKDMENASDVDGDYMRGKGTFDNSLNPNAYPMTDTYYHPSLLRVRVNGEVVSEFYLKDDPADHRGVLSWHAQQRDRKLREAGSYGYLCKARIPVDLIKQAENGTLTIRFEVDAALPGGLTIYSDKFGRYPVNPTIIFE
ncbi:MAG: glycoside hydrolase family 2 protein [Bacteroidota bacterium]